MTYFHWPLRRCARGTGSKCLFQNTPLIEFDTTSTQSQARHDLNPTNPTVQELVIHLHAGAIHCDGKW